MGPGLASGAACIAGIACAVIWKTQLLCIPFGAGAAGSIYNVYLGWTVADLKNHAENNKEQAVQIQRLTDEYDRLVMTGNALKASAERNEKSAREHETANATLNTEITRLTKTKDALETKCNAIVGQFEPLLVSFTGIRDAAQGDHAQFTDKLTIFKNHLDRLSQADAKIMEFNSSLAETLDFIAEWKDDEGVKNKISLMQQAQVALAENNALLSTAREDRARLEVQNATLSENVAELRLLKTNLSGTSNELQSRVDKLTRISEQMEAAMRKDVQPQVTILQSMVTLLEDVIKKQKDLQPDKRKPLEEVMNSLQGVISVLQTPQRDTTIYPDLELPPYHDKAPPPSPEAGAAPAPATPVSGEQA